MDTISRKKIRAAFILKGISDSELAKQLGLHRTAITNTINGRIKAFWIREAIANAIGMPVTMLWPDAVPCKRIRRGRKPGKKENSS